MLWNERRATRAEISIECIAGVARPATFDQRTGNVRSSNCGVTRAIENIVEGNRHTELVELHHDLPRAGLSAVAKRPQRVIERTCAADVETQQMYFSVIVDRAQLDARHDTHAQTLARRDGFDDAGHGVVIRDGDRREAGRFRRGHECRRRFRTVRRGRVGVQIDLRLSGPVGAGRHRSHFA